MLFNHFICVSSDFVFVCLLFYCLYFVFCLCCVVHAFRTGDSLNQCQTSPKRILQSSTVEHTAEYRRDLQLPSVDYIYIYIYLIGEFDSLSDTLSVTSNTSTITSSKVNQLRRWKDLESQINLPISWSLWSISSSSSVKRRRLMMSIVGRSTVCSRTG